MSAPQVNEDEDRQRMDAIAAVQAAEQAEATAREPVLGPIMPLPGDPGHVPEPRPPLILGSLGPLEGLDPQGQPGRGQPIVVDVKAEHARRSGAERHRLHMAGRGRGGTEERHPHRERRPGRRRQPTTRYSIPRPDEQGRITLRTEELERLILQATLEGTQQAHAVIRERERRPQRPASGPSGPRQEPAPADGDVQVQTPHVQGGGGALRTADHNRRYLRVVDVAQAEARNVARNLAENAERHNDAVRPQTLTHLADHVPQIPAAPAAEGVWTRDVEIIPRRYQNFSTENLEEAARPVNAAERIREGALNLLQGNVAGVFIDIGSGHFDAQPQLQERLAGRTTAIDFHEIPAGDYQTIQLRMIPETYDRHLPDCRRENLTRQITEYTNRQQRREERNRLVQPLRMAGDLITEIANAAANIEPPAEPETLQLFLGRVARKCTITPPPGQPFSSCNFCACRRAGQGELCA